MQLHCTTSAQTKGDSGVVVHTYSLHWKSQEEGGDEREKKKGLCALVRICAHDVMSTLPLSLFPISSSFSLFSGPSSIVCPSSTRIWATTKPLVFLPPPPPPHLSHTKKPKEEEGLFQTPSSPGDDDGCDCGGGRGGGGGRPPSVFPLLELLDPLRPSSRWKDALSLWPLFSRPDRPVCLSPFSSFSVAVGCASEAVFCIGEVSPVLVVLL